MKYAIMVLALVGVLARPTAAIAVTGNILLEACKENRDYCSFYAIGWSDGHAVTVPTGICIPSGLIATQMGDVLIKVSSGSPRKTSFKN